MIKIKEDKSYLSSLDLAAINNGIAEMGIHSLKITNFYTDEQKQENLKESKLLTREQWNERCDRVKKSIAEKVEKLIDAINDTFIIYQYKNREVDYSKFEWDLFFWCNSGDLSYVMLNPNSKRSIEQQKETIYKVLELLKALDVEGIQATIQYNTIYDQEKVKETVLDYCEKMKDTFINHGGYIGKIVQVGDKYVFRKKGAKKNYYHVNDNAVLKNVLGI